MNDEISELNAIYAPVCESAEKVRKLLHDRGLRSSTGFFNNHYVKADGEYVRESYPIPVMTVTGENAAFDIGFDVVKRNGKI